MLPTDLRLALERELTGIDSKRLTQIAAALSTRYREGHGRDSGQLLQTADDVLAYAAVRMPATWAAIHAALQASKQRIAGWQPSTCLDVGAGTGAASWAASVVFPTLQHLQLIERDRWMIATGQHIAKYARNPVLANAVWHQADVLGTWDVARHDLVTCGYVLGEIPTNQHAALIERLWQMTQGVLVLVEPGTPRGFAIIRSAREQLLSLDAQILAPCPHAHACPMQANNWCHFAQRLERSSLHRVLKNADRGFEDEKFSYLAVARFVGTPFSARVLRHPQIQPSRIELTLCCNDGTERIQTITKRSDDWKPARKLEWGDSF